jgi:hypothetical protein
MAQPARSHRRSLLRAAGVSLGLPWLESLAPRAARAAAAQPVRRMVCICSTLGHMPELWFPERPGRDYEPSPYLGQLADLRDRMTVFSGVSLPGVDGGHAADSAFLSGAPHPGSHTFRNTISLDQFAVESLPAETRFPSLVLGTVDNWSISVSRTGVPIPAESSPAALFRRLFVAGTPAEVEAQVRRLRTGRSILDAVQADARRLGRDASPSDRRTLDAYCATVREVEGRLVQAESWERRPKPTTTAAAPHDIPDKADVAGRTQLILDLVHLAVASDSTRVVSLRIEGIKAEGIPKFPGIREGWHNLSHHGHDEAKMAQLRVIETDQINRLAGFLRRLGQAPDGGGTLLDSTMVLYGSAIGNASSHSNANLPVILAGGGFRHGSHLAFDRTANYPLTNLYVSMLQRLGIETDHFASGTGTMRGLEMDS